MKVKVNGEEYEPRGAGTVLDLLRESGADGSRVAVMINDRVIPRADFGSVRLCEGDKIEILTFMGGG